MTFMLAGTLTIKYLLFFRDISDCQVSESTIVLTGGYYYPQSQVTEYSGIGEGEVWNNINPSL